jgi:hypothetical protein
VLFALVVMAGVLLLTMVVNNRRTPSRWEGVRSGGDASAWIYGGVDSGGDSGGDGGGGCDGGGGGGD